MDKFSCNHACNDCEIAEYVLNFRASLLDDVIRADHQVVQKIGFLVMIFITVKDAEQSKFIEIVHVLAVLLEELHPEAAMKY